MIWAVFYHGEKALAAYTVRGTFPGEMEETKKLLSYEHNIPQEEIRVQIETRKVQRERATMKKDQVYNRILGALVGVAVGDALGGPLEFMSAEEIQEEYGQVRDMIGGGWLNLAPGEVTDDTQMTMAVARGIMEDSENPIPKIGERFIRWYKSGPKDVGGICDMAIRVAIQSGANTAEKWRDAGATTAAINQGKSDGNGALMRTIFPAIAYHDARERQEAVRNIAEMTHMGADSTRICIEYAEAVHGALFGEDFYKIAESRTFIRGLPPTGYVVNTWSNVVEALLQSGTFKDTVINAVNRGGDADTIGAIAGGLAGAYYGYESIPSRWTSKLDGALLKEMRSMAEWAYKRLDT